MGQAKVKAKRHAEGEIALSKINLKVLSKIIQKAALKYHTRVGTDCIHVAGEAQIALNLLGVKNAIFSGGAVAWYVNETDAPIMSCGWGGTISALNTGFIGHCWVMVGYTVLDFTGYQLPIRAKLAEEADGIHTPIEYDVPDWCQVDIRTVNKLTDRKLMDTGKVGDVCYRVDPAVWTQASNDFKDPAIMSRTRVAAMEIVTEYREQVAMLGG